MISNASPLAKYTVVVYNTSVAASEQVADYYCQIRGIPTANKIGFAMGTGATWAWRADWYTHLLVPLYAKVAEVGAKAVLAAAGCPHSVLFTTALGAPNVAGVYLPTVLASVKALYCAGGEPWVEEANVNLLRSPLAPGSVAGWQGGNPPPFEDGSLLPAAETALDVGARASESPVYPWTSRLTATWRSEWDESAFLLKGLVGYSTWPDATHAVDLYDKSKAVIDRAVANEYPLAEARKQKVLVGMDYTSTGSTGTIYDALTISLLKQNGFENVVYWNEQGLGKAATDCLAPAPEKFGGATTLGARAQIAAGLAPPQNPWLVFGIGWDNGDVNPTPSAVWATFLGLVGRGVCFVGASYGLQWSRLAQANGGIGGNGSPSDVAHISYTYIVRGNSIFLALLAGLSICEAEVAGYVLDYATAGGVIGDPLMRPIVVNRDVAPSAGVSGTIPSGLSFAATTGVPRGDISTSEELLLTGFSGPVLLTFGAGKGLIAATVDGVMNAQGMRWIYGPCSVQLHYTTTLTFGDVATVQLRANGALVATWSVTNAP